MRVFFDRLRSRRTAARRAEAIDHALRTNAGATEWATEPDPASR